MLTTFVTLYCVIVVARGICKKETEVEDESHALQSLILWLMVVSSIAVIVTRITSPGPAAKSGEKRQDEVSLLSHAYVQAYMSCFS